MDASIPTSDIDFSGLKENLVYEERVSISRAEPGVTISRPHSSGYDSTGPNSLFDSLSPSPDPENRGRSPAVQPSPLRNVHTLGGMGIQGEQGNGENKAPLLLPGKGMAASAIEEDAPLEEGNEGDNDASRKEGTAQGDGDEQGEGGYPMSVPHSTTRIPDDLLTHDTTQSTIRTQSHNASPSTSSRGFQSGVTTAVCTLCSRAREDL